MKKIASLIVGIVLLAVPLAACSSAADAATTRQHTTVSTAKPKKHKKAKYTASQRQAIGSAKDYLKIGHFSRQGLIDQLTSKYGEGFKKKDAVFAVSHIKVNWNKQALGSAREYLKIMHFSRAGLIQQLTSRYGDRYTHAQAVYAANHVGL